jgi:hypothetical protein
MIDSARSEDARHVRLYARGEKRGFVVLLAGTGGRKRVS